MENVFLLIECVANIAQLMRYYQLAVNGIIVFS